MDTFSNLASRQKGIVGLAVTTAVIHIILALLNSDDMMFLVLFLLNGLGYLVLIAGLYFLPQLASQRSLVRWGLLAFTAVTFILYFVFNWPNIWGPIGIVDKLIELALMILLWQDK
ncbi:hypothetical protein [Candidatus Leptofilum sp.]|uniref:hypothetical protein n=1 Tax=Candidatus Leptofilum sp. TaxID=3241576 RepID=UPI003B5CAF5F